MKRILSLVLTLSLFLCLLITGQGSALADASPEASSNSASAVADASQMTTVEEVVEEGMVPVSGVSLVDGDYAVTVSSSSSMFRIVESTLHVSDGDMTVSLVMSGTSYLFVYPGTAQEAAAAASTDRISYEEDSEGRYCFTVPVEALDAGFPCAAFSKNKELWYDRTLLVRVDSLPVSAFVDGFFHTAESLGLSDGTYQVGVSLSGGSGRAKIQSPAQLDVTDGRCTATIIWGSKNYDYMKVGGEQFFPLEGEAFSTFSIPVQYFDRPIPVIADTVAMSEPHEIAYQLIFSSADITPLTDTEVLPSLETPMYAENFRVHSRPDGSLLLTLGGTEDYLLLDREADVPIDLPASLPVIRIPVDHVYAASSSVPDLFFQCGALDQLRFTSTDEASWRLPSLQEALRSNSLLYAGKYSAPDYELLLEEGCDLVIENTMILHSPAVQEKLESLGLPVMVEYSSYEPHPLGRVEWIRLYGLLTGHQAEADRFFSEQATILNQTAAVEPSEKTVAFFHITANGAASVRKSADYVTRMIELAGGASPFTDLPGEDTALSSVTIQFESFYAQAKDADVLIYNSTVGEDLKTLEDLFEKSSLFHEFSAVQSGEVWCTEQSMFQQSSATAGMIADIHRILSGEAEDLDHLTWLHRIV